MEQKDSDGIGNKIWAFMECAMDFLLRRIFHLKISDRHWNILVQFIKFGIVGLSNTIVSYVIYVIALLIFQQNHWIPMWDYLISQIIAFVLSVLWSFYWNNKYVFQKQRNTERKLLQTLIKMYISYAFTGLFLNSIFSLIWVEIFQISKLISPIINLLISVPLNFIINKFWTFKEK